MKPADRSLFDAIENDQPMRASAAIDNGADVNARNAWQETPLHLAAIQGHSDIVGLLIENGANVNATDESQLTPLHLAARVGHTETAKLLIENGADVNSLDKHQESPLAIAARNGNADMVALLEAAARKAQSHADRVADRRDADEKRQR